ncbi:MAG: indole-3-glycerol phosphate synthase TrpC [Rickettsiales bacterium]|nr:indole-3-glycerol phosphate synthase TrpC [Rickettsiales bacterium]
MTNTVLADICRDKREYVAECKAKTSEGELLARFEKVSPPRGFYDAIRVAIENGKTALIAEVKKASPSKGVIFKGKNFDPLVIAEYYETGGATCVSILTDEPYFQGHPFHLTHARAGIKIPVLRKDFMLDPYQIVESRALGADCILLIMAALSDEQAKELAAAAKELHIDVLIEVHDLEEMERVRTHLEPQMIGINNRNLKNMRVDLSVAESLIYGVPQDCIAVCESGIKTNQDIKRMKQAGFNCFLVGESLMVQDNITMATKELLGIA